MRTNRLSRTPSPGAGGGDRRGLVPRAEALAADLPPLLVAADRVAATVSQGVHGRRRVGHCETFWQFRRYQTGDPAQAVDWRQSAKSQPLYVRETEWEAAQSVWFWRDASPSMDYRSAPSLPTKGERADILLLALASLLVRGGERLALLGAGRPPAPGRAALTRLAATLEGKGRSDADLPGRERLPRHARVVLFGDLLAPLEAVKATIAGLAGQGVGGHLVQILDPAEETLPFAGRVVFEGLEGDTDVLFGRTESIRDDYRAALEAHRQGLRELARAAGWTIVTHHTDHPPQTVLLSLFLAIAERRGW